MGELSEWAKKQNPFLKINDKESVRVKWTGEFQEVPDTFNPGRFKMRYSFVTQEGETKMFETSSIQFAVDIDNMHKGTELIISRRGTGKNTQWFIEKASEIVGQPQVSESEEITEADW